MKYAVGYYSKFRYFHDVDEVIYNFEDLGEDKIFNTITESLPKSTIVIEIDSHVKVKPILYILNQIRDMYSDKEIILQVSLLDTSYEDMKLIREAEYRYRYYEPATKLSEVAAMKKLGACEITVAEDLCFDLKKLQSLRQEGIKLRVFPDVAQVASGCSCLPTLSKFFIRPEDLSLYEDYIDTIELWHRADRLSVIYEIYKQQQWTGNLELLVSSLNNIEIDNTGIPPFFGQARLKCGKRCTYSKCDICESIDKLADTLAEADVAIVKKKTPFEKISPEQKEKIYNDFIKGKENEFEINETAVLDGETKAEESVNTILV